MTSNFKINAIGLLALVSLPIPAVVFRWAGIMVHVSAILPASIVIGLVLGLLTGVVQALLRVGHSDLPRTVAVSFFGSMLLLGLSDFALFFSELAVPCEKVGPLSSALEVCDDASGPQGLCMESHMEVVSHDSACLVRALGPVTWPAANDAP
jgi:hypothetical protein